MDRASSLPPRRLSSPSNKVPHIRPRLNQYYTLDHAVSLLQSAKNIIVLTGAGISTSLGVPDFRSKNGVYNLLADSSYADPQDLFHIDNFKSDPGEFFRQAAKVFPKMQGLVPADGAVESARSADAALVPRFSLTHAFISVLQSMGKLLTNYTQNIDGLESAAGVASSKLIQCHGTLSTATCVSCGKRTTARKYMPIVRAGGIPFCKCSTIPEPKKSKPRGRGGKKKRKRDEFEDTESESELVFPRGILKPDMTFFGEGIANTYAPRLEIDKTKVDLLVIIGTSLQVEPVNAMLLAVPPTVPQIWISRDRCQREGVRVDIELLGECDLILEEIARRAGWESSLKERLWTKEKAAADAKGSPEKRKIASGQPKKENASPVKTEEPLQIRPKTNENSEMTLQPAPELVIKLNDKELKRSVPTSTQTRTVQAAPKELSKQSDYTSVNGNRSGKVTIPTSSKVIVELEEGTRSRWYVKRAKSRELLDSPIKGL